MTGQRTGRISATDIRPTRKERTSVQSARRRRRMQAIWLHVVDALLLLGIVAVLLLALALVPVAR